MDREQAKRNIKDTFEASFNEEKYIYFIMNLLNLKQSDIKNASFGVHQGYNIPEMFRSYISKFQRVAKYLKDDNRIDVLIVYLYKKTSIEYARSMQRNFISGYLKGNYGSDNLKDAALVAFVSPDEEDWRFSLVKIDYRFEEGKAGRKVKEEFTPARRWSFLVGKNEKSHTAQSQLVDILADDKHNPTITQLEEAFNIETVTNEFFLEYRNLFIRTKEALDMVVENNLKVKSEFEFKGVNTVDFAKKLLGQIIFLYFLQKRGWFGVGRDEKWGTGSKKFLRELFEKKHSIYYNFFNDILEPLFYEALRIDRSYGDDYYSRFNCKIPFLNGGLFDPIGNYDWVHIDITLPDSLFSNDVATKHGDTGNGILDIFDRYNFTVREDEPLEKEVAIDPELLGKAYEKFNAIRPDNFEEYKKVLKNGKKGNENKFNKQYGVYYTPREIVHYMCQQSLIHYLESELNGKTISYERLGNSNLDMFGNEVRKGQLDITIEHKEFPAIPKEDIEKFIQLGEQFKENDELALIKEEEINNGNQKSSTIEPLLPESIQKNASIIDKKLEDITICDPAVGSGAFPVGMMNEIVKARTLLNLYLKNDSHTIYYFKRQCIEKSLYGVDIDPGAVEIAKLRLWLSLIVEEEDFKNIKQLPNLDYKIMQGSSLISEFMGINFDTDLENNQYSELLPKDDSKIIYETLKIKKEDLINQADVNKKVILRKEIEDLIINLFEIKLQKQKSNYFRNLEDIKQKYKNHPVKEEREREIKREKDKLFQSTGFNLDELEKQLRQYTSSRKIRPFFPWKLYFSEVFQEKNGFDIVIANPPYIRQENIDFKETLKEEYIIYDSVSDLYTYFYEKGFNILKQVGVLTYITSNKFLRARYGKHLRNYLQVNVSIKDVINFGSQHMFEATTNTLIFIANKGKNQNTVFDYSDNIEVPEKIKFPQSALQDGEWTIEKPEIINLKSKIEKMGISLKEWNIKINYGIKTGYNEAFIIDLDTRDRICQKDQKSSEIIKPIIRGRDIKRYHYVDSGKYLIATHNGYTTKNGKKLNPVNIYNYPFLKKHFDNYKQYLEKRKDMGITIYNLRDCAFMDDFFYEKIIWHELTNINKFAYSDKEDYLLAGSFFMVGESLKYLLAVLNSKLCLFYFSLICNSSGMDTIQWKKFALEKLPIMKIDNVKQQPFIDMVDKIINITKQNDYLLNKEKQKKVKELEEQIDQMIYQLYNLTEGEIEIVENFNK
jgi:hypothetical protein